MPQKNIDLLKKVLKQITEDPDSHDQGEWEIQTPCGTTRCVGGWALHLSSQQVYAEGYGLVLGQDSSAARAAHVLGLNGFERDALFYWADNDEAVELLQHWTDETTPEPTWYTRYQEAAAVEPW